MCHQAVHPRVHTVVLGVVNTLHILFLHSIFCRTVHSRHNVFIFYVLSSLLRAWSMCPYSRSVVFHFRHLLVNSFPQHVHETGMGTSFAKTQGYATCVWVCFQNRLTNLATAVQVSIDTAVHIARLTIRGGGLVYHP